MAAYVIADLDVHDDAAYEDYRARVAAVVERFGGRFVVRGGRSETLEGDWKPKRLVVVEFPSMDRAMQFYRSPEYRPLLELRLRAARSTVVVVEGA